MDAAYWHEEADKFRERAAKAENRSLAQEFIELAETCEQVAADLHDRALPG